ncbi:transcription intermediary factor 1-beta-like [Cyprinodon tularosa]|uniref:transcription intermediary factor 1-beta-like n=1 Tax=Cyprinodon tularosa TaxID=77115 RepID=UPI0018E26445|nr:transcription intermediary factor 1-beta-like [Cyprinodon tularosa]
MKPVSPGDSDDEVTVLANEPEEESSPDVYEVKPCTSRLKPMDVFSELASPVPSEDQLSLALSEEPELGLKLSSSEASDGEGKEPPSSRTDRQDYSQLQWQPTVSLLRLPLSLPGHGRPPPRYHFIGSKEDELYLQEVEENAQSSEEESLEAVTDNSSEVTEDFTEPQSPLSLEVISCAACGSASASKICTVCSRGYHRDCHVPPFGPDIWSELVCSLCQDLSDPSDPFSSDRPRSPQCSLSLQDQRRCETLLLHLKVDGCTRFSQMDFWSDLMLISERLSLRLSPAYRTPAELVSDLWHMFSDAPQDASLTELQQNFQKKLVETLGSELHPSLLKPPNCSDPTEPSSSANTSRKKRELEEDEEEEEECMSESRLQLLRKRLRDFLDLRGGSAANRPKKRKQEDGSN